ncbi:FG-GAP repeat protein [Bdellovibrio bacteriovorus]|uniref:FG-GAP repeat protein n=1 Tax=Bdellovibrio bacteriovorus TaxID=959 RepID=UPI0035A668E9
MRRLSGTWSLIVLCFFLGTLSGCALDIQLSKTESASLLDFDFPAVSKLVGNKATLRGSRGETFARSVALSEDGTTLVVGASSDDTDALGKNSLNNAGAVFVFIRSDDEWVLQQKLVPSGLNARMAGDNFGYSVAISGDTIVVGAYLHDYDANGENFVTNAGAVYVFTRTNDVWAQQQKLVASGLNSRVEPSSGSGDVFGYSVAIAGDTIVVGSYGQSYDADGANYLLRTGAAYVFIRSGNSWTQQQKLVGSGTNGRVAEDNFGKSVAISGDSVVVGAERQRYNATGTGSLSNAGAAYVFTRSGTVWSQQQKLVASGTNGRMANDYFGCRVAISGDTVVVGAYQHDYDAAGATNVAGAGAAFVFTRSGTVWSQQQKLVASGTNNRMTSDFFGINLAISGDMIVVGAYPHNWDENGANSLDNAGAVYVFARSGAVWSQQQKLVGFGTNGRQAGDSFGYSVAIVGDVIVSGAINQDFDAEGANTSSNTGAAYLFERSAGVWNPHAKLVDEMLISDRSFDLDPGFGGSTALSENGDILVVGAPQDSFDEENQGYIEGAGAAYVYVKENGAWKLQQKLVAGGLNGRMTGDNFGSSVAISGDTIVVGAYMHGYDVNGDNLAAQAGAAYVFVKSGSQWVQQQKLVGTGVNGRMSSDQFGYKVAISGDTIVVGAAKHAYDENGDNMIAGAGAAYVFTRSGTSWTLQQKLVGVGSNSRVTGDLFGYSVAISGNTIAVGAPQQSYDANGDNMLSAAGAVYVFTRSGTSWTLQQKLVGGGVNGRVTYDLFGFSVAISGNTIVAGAIHQSYDANGDNMIAGAGAAYVFTRSEDVWSQERKLVGRGVNGRNEDDIFGGSVALAGWTLAVGAPGQDYDEDGGEPASDAGAVWVFNLLLE